MTTIPTAESLVGRSLFAQTGEAVGLIRTVYVDPHSARPLWAYVDRGAVVPRYRQRGSYLPLIDVDDLEHGVRIALGLPEIDAVATAAQGVSLPPAVEMLLSTHVGKDLGLYKGHSDLLAVGADPTTLTQSYLGATTDLGADPPTDLPPSAQPRRFLQARCAPRIALGKTLSVSARIGLAADGLAAEIAPFDVPPEGADLTIVLTGPRFRATGDGSLTRTVHLPPDGPSQWALFELAPETEGVHELTLIVFRGGTSVGELAIHATVVADAKPAPVEDHVSELESVEGVAGEVTLFITYDGADRYRFLLFDEEQPGREEITSPLLSEPRDEVTRLIASLNAAARDQHDTTPKNTERWLRQQGIGLWDKLIPAALQEEFWARQERIASLTIIAARDTVPWELLYPLGETSDRDRGFLAEQFPIVRAIPQCRRPLELPLGGASFVKPDAAPPLAEMEIEKVAALLGASADTAIRNLDRLTELIEQGDFGVLHFACHNTFQADAPDASAIAMSGGRFMPSLLNGAAKQHTLSRTRPLIFMNACSTAQMGGMYTEMTGWASAFIRAGAGAFVGSQWEVRDAAAPVFAEAFYRAAVIEKQPLGEALQRARAELRETVGDPSWLAYSLYARARARVA